MRNSTVVCTNSRENVQDIGGDAMKLLLDKAAILAGKYSSRSGTRKNCELLERHCNR